MEIYNENVKDLLRPDSGPLRLLDDPEVCNFVELIHYKSYFMPQQWNNIYMIKQKGTIVEKLDEEIAKDSQHLRHLIGICEGTAAYV